MNYEYDVILVGAGLANCLIALLLRQTYPKLRCLILEKSSQFLENHTWSFHRFDITNKQFNWLKPLISFHWNKYQVYFPCLFRNISSDYYSITSYHFRRYLIGVLGNDLCTSINVIHVLPTKVVLDDYILRARVVIDGRGLQLTPHISYGYQVFIGQEWQLKKPHNLLTPILMDATVSQEYGYHFMYILPFNPYRLLIEDTYYTDNPILLTMQLRRNIMTYANNHYWQLDYLVREEQGVLPIILSGNINAFWQYKKDQPCSGLCAGLFHATTGYSLPIAINFAEFLVKLLPFENVTTIGNSIKSFAIQHWHNQSFFRLLNRILFLASPPEDRWRIIQNFYNLDENLISRFYSGKLLNFDKIRILCGRPPVSVFKALRAILMFNSQNWKKL